MGALRVKGTTTGPARPVTVGLQVLPCLSALAWAVLNQRRAQRLAKQAGTISADVEHRVAERTAQLQELVLRDELTGMYNRRYLRQELPRLISASRRAGQPVCLAMVDIDEFKAINDRHGHALGDVVLRRFAKVLSEGIRAGDTAARVGGDEFVIIWPHTDARHAAAACERLRCEVKDLCWPETTGSRHITASFGLIEASPDTPPGRVWAHADGLLLAAKRAGKNQVAIGRTPQ